MIPTSNKKNLYRYTQKKDTTKRRYEIELDKTNRPFYVAFRFSQNVGSLTTSNLFIIPATTIIIRPFKLSKIKNFYYIKLF